MSQVDLNRYKDFVREVTSNESLSSMQMYNRIVEIETTESKMKVNMAQLMTCLLYTSPSPRDRQKSRMPSSA